MSNHDEYKIDHWLSNRAIHRVRTLPLSPERVAQKRFFRFFWNKRLRLIVSGAVNLGRR